MHTIPSRHSVFPVVFGDRRIPSAAASEVWLKLLQALRNAYPLANLPDFDGLCEATADSSATEIRYGRDAASGFWALEVCDLAAAERWSAFLLPLPDGTWRTGWARSGPLHDVEPTPWLEAVSDLKLGEAVQPLQPPTFMALIAALSASSTPTFSIVHQPVIDAMASEIDEQRRMLHEQAVAMRALRQSLTVAGKEDWRDEQIAAPQEWALSDIGRWASDNYDRIVVLPRAIAEAKKSQYADPKLVFDALEMLADIYPRVRKGDLPRDALMNRCLELGLSIGGSVDPSRAGQAGSDYFVSWDKRRRFLDQHLSKGISRDPRHCMRIYFFYDEHAQKVVCGWLPTHLSNSKT